MPSSQLIPNPTAASSRCPAPPDDRSEGSTLEDRLAEVDAWTAECQQLTSAVFPILSLLPPAPSTLQLCLSELPELDILVEAIPRLIPSSVLLEYLIPYFPEDVAALRPRFLDLKEGTPV
ncbi:hypothetical protein JCM8547_000085 [Rhodosporidiobolus lusitaniae]